MFQAGQLERLGIEETNDPNAASVVIHKCIHTHTHTIHVYVHIHAIYDLHVSGWSAGKTWNRGN